MNNSGCLIRNELLTERKHMSLPPFLGGVAHHFSFLYCVFTLFVLTLSLLCLGCVSGLFILDYSFGFF
jgi:hypothetical protein